MFSQKVVAGCYKARAKVSSLASNICQTRSDSPRVGPKTTQTSSLTPLPARLDSCIIYTLPQKPYDWMSGEKQGVIILGGW